MKKKKILFVCKYNRFRSRVAEAYFKKINKNKNIQASSAGLLEGYLPLDKTQVKAAKNFGFSILGKPRAMNMDLLAAQDIIVVVADDVPREIFTVSELEKRMYKYGKRVVLWNISDVASGKSVKRNNKIIRAIITKVNQLNKQLEKEYGTCKRIS